MNGLFHNFDDMQLYSQNTKNLYSPTFRPKRFSYPKKFDKKGNFFNVSHAMKDNKRPPIHLMVQWNEIHKLQSKIAIIYCSVHLFEAKRKEWKKNLNI